MYSNAPTSSRDLNDEIGLDTMGPLPTVHSIDPTPDDPETESSAPLENLRVDPVYLPVDENLAINGQVEQEWGTVGDVWLQFERLDTYRVVLLITMACLAALTFTGMIIEASFRTTVYFICMILMLTIASSLMKSYRVFEEAFNGQRHRLSSMSIYDAFLCYIYGTDRTFQRQDMRTTSYTSRTEGNLPRTHSVRINVLREHTKNPRSFHCYFDNDRTYGRRTYTSVMLQDVLKANALIDTGATSCVIDNSALSQIESRLGFRLPRLDTENRVMGFLQDQHATNLGCVPIDLQFANETNDKTYVLHGVPFYIVQGTSSRVILGQNVIASVFSQMNLAGPSPFVTFRNPHFGRVKVKYQHGDDDSYSLHSEEDMYVHPREAKVACISLKNSYGRETDLDDEPLLLNERPVDIPADAYNDCVWDMADTLRLKRGGSKIMIRNTSNRPIYIAKGDALFDAIKINQEKAVNVNPIIESIKAYKSLDPKDMKACPCKETVDGDVMYITDPYGYTYHGPTARDLNVNKGRHLNTGFHKVGDAYYAVPNKGHNFDSLMSDDKFADIAHTRFRHNTLYVLHTEHMMLSDSLLRFLRKLNYTVEVRIRTISEKLYCRDCFAHNLSGLTKLPFLRDTRRLKLIIPSHHPINKEGDHIQTLTLAVKSAPRFTFSLSHIAPHVHASAYITGNKEMSVIIHTPAAKAVNEAFIREITQYVLAECKRVFYKARLEILSNVPKKSDFRQWLRDAFQETRHFVTFPFLMRKDQGSWNNSKEAKHSIDATIKGCTCTLCTDESDPSKQAYMLRVVTKGEWPSPSLSEIESHVEPSTLAMETLLDDKARPPTVNVLSEDPISIKSEVKSEAKSGIARVNDDASLSGSKIPLSLKEEAEVPKLPPYASSIPPSDRSIILEARKEDPDNRPMLEDTSPLQEASVEDLLNPGPNKPCYNARGQFPLPQEGRKACTLGEIDNYFDFTKVSTTRVIPALRLFLFAFRDVLLFDKEEDFSYIKVLAAKLYPRPECVGKTYHAKPYPASNDMMHALNVFVEKKLQQGLFTASNKHDTMHSYPAFLVVKNSDIKIANKLETKADVRKLDISPEKKWRFVVDASKQQSRLIDNYNQSVLRALNHLAIGDHVSRGSTEGKDGIISTADVADAFGRVLVSSTSRKYNGVSLPGFPIYESVPLIQGSFLSPSIFVQSLHRALSTRSKQVTLTYMDDLLINNDRMTDKNKAVNNIPAAASDDGRCVHCHMIGCTECIPDTLPPVTNISEAFLHKNKDNIHTFMPHDQDTFIQVLRSMDPKGYLPIEEMADSYFSIGAPLNKGQDWSTARRERDRETLPLTETEACDWTDDEIRNHFSNLCQLFSDLRNAGIMLSATKEKLQLFRSELKYFGHNYTTQKVAVTEDRSQYFDHYRSAENVKDARKFAGAVNFIASFIPDLAYLLRPLHASFGGSDKEPLSPLQKKVINQVIDQVQSLKALPILPSEKQLVIFTDASLLAAGVIAGFYDLKGDFNPTIFYTKNFDPCIARGMSAIEKEFIAIALFLRLHPEATQRSKRTVIVTDSRGVYLLWKTEAISTLSSRVGRAVLFLRSQPLNIRILHRPATHEGICISDALSRFLNKAYTTRDSLTLKEAYDQAEHTERTGSPLPVDPMKLLPTKLCQKDRPMEDLSTLLDCYMRGFLTRAKKYADDSFSEVVEQMHGAQFPRLSALKEARKDSFRYSAPDNMEDDHSHQNREIKRHSWCQDTCLNTHGFEKSSVDTPPGPEKIPMQVVRSLVYNEPLRANIHDENTRKVMIHALTTLNDITKEEVAQHIDAINPLDYFDPIVIQKAQLADPKYGKLINLLLTKPKDKIPERVKRRYLLLSSNLLGVRSDNELGFKIVIPTSSALYLVCATHTQAHFSMKNVHQTLSKLFKIDHLNELVTMVAHSCLPCLYNRPSTKREQLPGRAIRGKRANDIATIDHMFMPIAVKGTKKYKCALVYMDTFTKNVIVYPTVSTDAKEVLEVLTKIFAAVGKPNAIVSDHGSAFTSQAYFGFMKEHGVDPIFYESYVPKGHLIERSNLMVRQVMDLILTGYKTRNWVTHLVKLNEIMKALPQTYIISKNDGTSTKVKMSAFEFINGYPPPRSLESQYKDLYGMAEDPAKMLQIRNDLHAGLAETYRLDQELIKTSDQKYEDTQQRIKLGSYVLLERPPNDIKQKKHTRFFKNPYKITFIHGRKVGITDPFREGFVPKSVHIERVKPLNVDAAIYQTLPRELRIAMGAADLLIRNPDSIRGDSIFPLQSILAMKKRGTGQPKLPTKKGQRKLRDTGSRDEPINSSESSSSSENSQTPQPLMQGIRPNAALGAAIRRIPGLRPGAPRSAPPPPRSGPAGPLRPIQAGTLPRGAISGLRRIISVTGTQPRPPAPAPMPPPMRPAHQRPHPGLPPLLRHLAALPQGPAGTPPRLNPHGPHVQLPQGPYGFGPQGGSLTTSTPVDHQARPVFGFTGHQALPLPIRQAVRTRADLHGPLGTRHPFTPRPDPGAPRIGQPGLNSMPLPPNTIVLPPYAVNQDANATPRTRTHGLEQVNIPSPPEHSLGSHPITGQPDLESDQVRRKLEFIENQKLRKQQDERYKMLQDHKERLEAARKQEDIDDKHFEEHFRQIEEATDRADLDRNLAYSDRMAKHAKDAQTVLNKVAFSNRKISNAAYAKATKDALDKAHALTLHKMEEESKANLRNDEEVRNQARLRQAEHDAKLLALDNLRIKRTQMATQEESDARTRLQEDKASQSRLVEQELQKLEQQRRLQIYEYEQDRLYQEARNAEVLQEAENARIEQERAHMARRERQAQSQAQLREEAQARAQNARNDAQARLDTARADARLAMEHSAKDHATRTQQEMERLNRLTQNREEAEQHETDMHHLQVIRQLEEDKLATQRKTIALMDPQEATASTDGAMSTQVQQPADETARLLEQMNLDEALAQSTMTHEEEERNRLLAKQRAEELKAQARPSRRTINGQTLEQELKGLTLQEDAPDPEGPPQRTSRSRTRKKNEEAKKMLILSKEREERLRQKNMISMRRFLQNPSDWKKPTLKLAANALKDTVQDQARKLASFVAPPGPTPPVYPIRKKRATKKGQNTQTHADPVAEQAQQVIHEHMDPRDLPDIPGIEPPVVQQPGNQVLRFQEPLDNTGLQFLDTSRTIPRASVASDPSQDPLALTALEQDLLNQQTELDEKLAREMQAEADEDYRNASASTKKKESNMANEPPRRYNMLSEDPRNWDPEVASQFLPGDRNYKTWQTWQQAQLRHIQNDSHDSAKERTHDSTTSLDATPPTKRRDRSQEGRLYPTNGRAHQERLSKSERRKRRRQRKSNGPKSYIKKELDDRNAPDEHAPIPATAPIRQEPESAESDASSQGPGEDQMEVIRRNRTDESGANGARPLQPLGTIPSTRQKAVHRVDPLEVVPVPATAEAPRREPVVPGNRTQDVNPADPLADENREGNPNDYREFHAYQDPRDPNDSQNLDRTDPNDSSLHLDEQRSLLEQFSHASPETRDSFRREQATRSATQRAARANARERRLNQARDIQLPVDDQDPHGQQFRNRALPHPDNREFTDDENGAFTATQEFGHDPNPTRDLNTTVDQRDGGKLITSGNKRKKEKFSKTLETKPKKVIKPKEDKKKKDPKDKADRRRSPRHGRQPSP